MLTTIDIDDELLASAMAITGQTTPESAVSELLRRVVQLHGQRLAIDQMAGFGWEGDLDSMREGRQF